MLYLTLRDGDYVKVDGSVVVHCFHSKGKDTMLLGFDAPKDVQILRGKHYDEELSKLVAEGDEKAKELSETLAALSESRQQKKQQRKTRSAGRRGLERHSDAEKIKPLTTYENEQPKPANDKKLNVKYNSAAL